MFGVLTLINRKLAGGLSSIQIAFYQDVFAGLALLPLAAFSSGHQPFSGTEILGLAVLGILFTAGAHTLFISGLKSCRAGTAGLVSTLEAVYGILLAYLFLGEIPALRTLTGGVIILAAVVFVTIRAGIKSGRPSFTKTS